MRQTNFSVGRAGGPGWDQLILGLQQGNVGAYVLLVVLIAGATVAIWAGSGMLKKGTGR